MPTSPMPSRGPLRGTQGCRDLCFGGLSTYGKPNLPLSWIQPSGAVEETGPILVTLWTTADVLISDCEGPKMATAHHMDYEMDSMDGAYKGCLHVAWPFIVRKTLTERRKDYNNVYMFRTPIERLFPSIWHWGSVSKMWRGSSTELQEYVRALLHLQEFLIRRQVRYPSYGPLDRPCTCTCMGCTYTEGQ